MYSSLSSHRSGTYWGTSSGSRSRQPVRFWSAEAQAGRIETWWLRPTPLSPSPRWSTRMRRDRLVRRSSQEGQQVWRERRPGKRAGRQRVWDMTGKEGEQQEASDMVDRRPEEEHRRWQCDNHIIYRWNRHSGFYVSQLFSVYSEIHNHVPVQLQNTYLIPDSHACLLQVLQVGTNLRFRGLLTLVVVVMMVCSAAGEPGVLLA